MPYQTINPLDEAKRKLAAIAWAERRVQTRLRDIEWNINELQPALKRLDVLAAAGRLPDIELIEGGVLNRLKAITDASSES